MNVNTAPAGTPIAPPLWKTADVADVCYLQRHDADDAERIRKTLSDAQAYVSDRYVADLRRSGNPNRMPRPA